MTRAIPGPFHRHHWDGVVGRGFPESPGISRTFDSRGLFGVDSAQLALEVYPRVLLIGDSNVSGLGVATNETYGEVSDTCLPDTDVINLGVPGYSSFQGVRLTAGVSPVDPAERGGGWIRVQ